MSRPIHPCLRCGLVLLAAAIPSAAFAQPVRVGSKADTETTILAEVVGHLVREAGFPVELKARLGGTVLVYDALRADSLDVYPEYTGTLSEQIFAGKNVRGEEGLRAELAKHGLGVTRPLGFANNYALGMRRARATDLGIKTISDLRKHPNLRLGFSSEFLKRADGWPGLRARYGLPQTDPRGMDHRLAYEALAEGAIDVTELYTTDAEIKQFDLVTLADDLGFFPLYEAVLVYRLDLEQRAPAAVAAFKKLEGKVSADAVIAMNGRATERVPPGEIAADFVREQFGFEATAATESDARRLWRLTLEHLTLVGVALGASILVALPLGILAARRPGLGRVLLGVAGVIQTIPSLALLVFMIPLLKTGTLPAIVALFLYGLLPIMANTAAGLRGIPPSITESAEALGLSAAYRALIGAGGYGQPIQTGLQLNDHREILFGAVPAAVLALVVQGLFELAERAFVPRGLRLEPVT
jgi:osmoprotectant transport system permease protein